MDKRFKGNTYIIHRFIRLVLTQGLPFLDVCTLLNVPLNNLDLGDT